MAENNEEKKFERKRSKDTLSTKDLKRTTVPDMISMTYSQYASKTAKDPFTKWYRESEGSFDIIKPVINPAVLARLVDETSFLVQCIKAMTTNVHGFGYSMEYISKEGDQMDPAPQEELRRLEQLFDKPNLEMSFQELRERLAKDYFTFGNAYMEIGRDERGRVVLMNHIPAMTMRITKVEKEPVIVRQRVQRDGRDFTVRMEKHFRRFVQIHDLDRKIYFKEFGDPRNINPRTGLPDANIALEDAATEVIHLTEYNPSSVYGKPDWYTQLPSVTGSRQAELTNLDFFENNAIPAMAILVSGGYLTQESFDTIRNNFEQIKGRGSVNKVMLLEARGSLEDQSINGQVPVPTVQMKPLYSDRQNDALFQDYEQQARDKIRASFRLPPVFTGSANDYTFASAKVSLEVAESQIFGPERNKFDDIVNGKILETWNPQFWRFRSNPASIATTEDLINSIEAFTEAGAITPNTALHILNEKLNLDIPKIKEFWGDLPFMLTNSILRAQGGEDKTNFIINAFKVINNQDIDSMQPIKVQTPGNADAITDPENDPKDRTDTPGRPSNSGGG